MTELRDITKLHVQCNDHLASLVINMEKENKLSQPARYIIRKIIHSPINSKDGIKLVANNLGIILMDKEVAHHQLVWTYIILSRVK